MQESWSASISGGAAVGQNKPSPPNQPRLLGGRHDRTMRSYWWRLQPCSYNARVIATSSILLLAHETPIPSYRISAVHCLVAKHQHPVSLLPETYPGIGRVPWREICRPHQLPRAIGTRRPALLLMWTGMSFLRGQALALTSSVR